TIRAIPPIKKGMGMATRRTSKQSASKETLQRLRDLALDPTEQATYAATLLDARNGAEVILAVLQILTRAPHAPARVALWSLYDYYAGRGQQQDAAAYLRSAIVRALREVVLPEDVPRLAKVAATYVFPPPQFKEEGSMLRSAALAALNELDDDLGRYHAVRLLANEHTDPMSGEPALTAAKVLAMRGEVLPLYFYVMQDGARTLPEVVSACLGNLTSLRADLLPDLLDRFRDSATDDPSEIVLVGLFDLLLNHEDGPQALDFITTFLQTSDQLDAYRYLVVTMATSGKGELVDLLMAQAGATTSRNKAMILCDALALLPQPHRAVKQLITELQTVAAARR
ncbi:MAG: hypothetical protein KDE58_26465, partial [Caldilineaceae bacterium]|nr:hypothetical protein [Caldilineaceae bacterium]